MNIFIDCTSGAAHLIGLSNELYANPVKSHNFDEQFRILYIFKQCYFNGCIASRCGRPVIQYSTLINNINTEILKLKTTLISCDLSKILASAFQGIWDNCATHDNSDCYLPEPPAPPKPPPTRKIVEGVEIKRSKKTKGDKQTEGWIKVISNVESVIRTYKIK